MQRTSWLRKKLGKGKLDLVKFLYLIQILLTALIVRILNIKRPKHLDGRCIVFNPVMELGNLRFLTEVYMAFSLSLRGAKCIFLINDDILSHRDSYQFSKVGDFENIVKANTKLWSRAEKRFLKRLFRVLNGGRMRFIYYSSVVKEEGIGRFDNIESIRPHIDSSLKRFFESDIYNNKSVFYKETERNAIISSLIGEYIVSEVKPDLFITSHGIYASYGPCYDVVRSNGFKTVVYALHVLKPGNLLLSDIIFQNIAKDSNWQHFSKRQLKPNEIIEGENYFEQRFKKETQDNRLYYINDVNKSVQKELEEFLSDNGEITFWAFPNVIWDGNVPSRDIIYNSISEWLKDAVNIIADSNNRLVIRFHPSEATYMKGTRTFQSIIEHYIADIDSRNAVYCIPSDAGIDVYGYMKSIDIGLVYDGTIATELVYKGIPVLSGGYGRFSQPKWAYVPESIEEYRDWLLNPDQIFSDFKKTCEQRRKEVLKFTYWYSTVNRYRLSILKEKFPHETRSLSKAILKMKSSKEFTHYIQRCLES